jgi:predicted DNA-binding protein YlxM (UPF0122 family)
MSDATQREAFDRYEKAWDLLRHYEELWAAMEDGEAREDVWEDMREAQATLDRIEEEITTIRKQEAL